MFFTENEKYMHTVCFSGGHDSIRGVGLAQGHLSKTTLTAPDEVAVAVGVSMCVLTDVSCFG